jgi:hypothetical protein
LDDLISDYKNFQKPDYKHLKKSMATNNNGWVTISDPTGNDEESWHSIHEQVEILNNLKGKRIKITDWFFNLKNGGLNGVLAWAGNQQDYPEEALEGHPGIAPREAKMGPEDAHVFVVDPDGALPDDDGSFEWLRNWHASDAEEETIAIPAFGNWGRNIMYPLKIEVWEEEQKKRPKSAMKTGKRQQT